MNPVTPTPESPRSTRHREFGLGCLLGKASLSIFAVMLFSPWVATISAASSPERPNIRWISSEDHGPQMGCYGDTFATTPNVDALAAHGMLFKHAWSAAPVCAPTRTVIISGLFGPSAGAEHMRSEVPMPAGKKMFPQFLAEAGYYCSNNNKEDYNLNKPGEVWAESSRDATLEKRKPGQQFLAVFNASSSHESQLRRRPHKAIHEPAKVRVPAYHPDTPEVRQDWAQYYDTVSTADATAGEHLKNLAAAGLTEDTIVFYWVDHGSGMPRSKRWPGNSGLQVPVVVYFPEKWRHLAPKEFQFKTPTTQVWWKLFTDGKTTKEQSAFWTTPKAPEELYDLQTDPDEVHNLAAVPEHQATLLKLRQVQQTLTRQTRDTGFLAEAEMHERSGKDAPYDMGHDPKRYDFERIFTAAELAAGLELDAVPTLKKFLGDADSGVRYWGAACLRMRGGSAVTTSKPELLKALADTSASVRVAATEALGRYGGATDLERALKTLGEAVIIAPMNFFKFPRYHKNNNLA